MSRYHFSPDIVVEADGDEDAIERYRDVLAWVGEHCPLGASARTTEEPSTAWVEEGEA